MFCSEEEIENYKEAFCEFDTDGSGNISTKGNTKYIQSYFRIMTRVFTFRAPWSNEKTGGQPNRGGAAEDGQ